MTPTCDCGAPVSRAGRRCRQCGHAGAWDKRFATAEQRFWAKVDRSAGPDECWPWTGAASPQGYGHARFERRQIAAHRLALQYATGQMLAVGMHACHRCDNPHCCNPAHLFAGTAFDNNLDMTRKGRRRSGGSFRYLTDAEVAAIREGREAGVKVAELAATFHVHPETIRRLDRQPDGTFLRRRTFAARDETWVGRAA